MATNIITDIKAQKIGKESVVVLPLKVWQIVAERLEELEMANSESLRKKIRIARRESKFYTPSEVRKMLKI